MLHVELGRFLVVAVGTLVLRRFVVERVCLDLINEGRIEPHALDKGVHVLTTRISLVEFLD